MFGSSFWFAGGGYNIKTLKVIILILLFATAACAEYPQRIISGMPSITEMLYALSLEARVVGVTSNCNYPPEVKGKEKVGGFFMNLEKVVSLKPDLIIMLEDAQKRDVKKYQDFGLPVYPISPRTVLEVMGTLVELGEVTGAKEEAAAAVSEIKKRLLTVEARVKDMPLEKVLVIVGYKPLIVVGGDNFIDDILRYAGAANIAGKAKAAYPQYSFELLLKQDPDHIIITQGIVGKKEIVGNRRWRSLSAVKNGRILFIDADVLSRPGPRVVEAVEQIAEFIHETET